MRLAIYSFVAGLALASVVPVMAQDKPAVPVEKPADPPKAPEFSAVEKAAIDLVAVMKQRDDALNDLGQCIATLSPLQAQARDGQIRQRVEALRAAFRKNHPGYEWDVQKGTLVPVAPKAAQAAPK
jgi:hypothetical protein